MRGQLLIILILILIYIVGFMPVELSTPFNFVLIFGHIIVHNWGLGATAIVYCADIVDDLSLLIIVLRFCSFCVALAS